MDNEETTTLNKMRQLYYQLVSRGLIQHNKESYNEVVRDPEMWALRGRIWKLLEKDGLIPPRKA